MSAHREEELASRLELLHACALDCRDVGATTADLRAAISLDRKYEGLTERQQDVIEFIRAYMVDWGRCPSVREIASGVGLASTSTVHAHLRNLERAGVLMCSPSAGVPRALVIL